MHGLHNKELCFTSWQKDIEIVNAGLDIVTLTSLNEGTPVSLIEAQAANKAIVSTNVGGIKDIIHEEETGLLVDKNNYRDFFSLIIITNYPTIVADDPIINDKLEFDKYTKIEIWRFNLR